MKVKTIKQYHYGGLGLSVVLRNVRLCQVQGQWQPMIDIREVATTLFQSLVLQPQRLTGHQVKFIRTYLQHSLRKFATTVVHQSHTSVAKWEKFANQSTNMDLNIEMMLRLYIFANACEQDSTLQASFYSIYQKIRQLPFDHEPPGVIEIANAA